MSIKEIVDKYYEVDKGAVEALDELFPKLEKPIEMDLEGCITHIPDGSFDPPYNTATVIRIDQDGIWVDTVDYPLDVNDLGLDCVIKILDYISEEV